MWNRDEKFIISEILGFMESLFKNATNIFQLQTELPKEKLSAPHKTKFIHHEKNVFSSAFL